MKFSISFLVAVVPLLFQLAVTTQAAPLLPKRHRNPPSSDLGLTAGSDDLRVRNLAESFAEDLLARAPALNPQQLSQRIQATQKGQTARKVVVDKKKALNGRTTKNLKKPKTGDPAKMTPQDKLAHSNMNKAISQARKDTKTSRTAKWNAKKNTPEKAADNKKAKAQRRKDRKAAGTPAPPPKAPGQKALDKKARKAFTPAEKKQVKDAFAAANANKKNVVNLPGRKDTFEVGGNKFSGKDVRQGVFNTYLHQGRPIGDNPANRNPKTFNNSPYSATHPDPSLRGKAPLPAPGQEYPIKNSKNGWIGSGNVGAGRVVTYTNAGGRPEVAVIGHDASRGGDPSDHYVAKHTKAP